MEAKREKSGPALVMKGSDITEIPGHYLNDGSKIGELLDIGGNASIFHLGTHRVIKVQESHGQLADEIYTIKRLREKQKKAG